MRTHDCSEVECGLIEIHACSGILHFFHAHEPNPAIWYIVGKVRKLTFGALGAHKLPLLLDGRLRWRSRYRTDISEAVQWPEIHRSLFVYHRKYLYPRLIVRQIWDELKREIKMGLNRALYRFGCKTWPMKSIGSLIIICCQYYKLITFSPYSRKNMNCLWQSGSFQIRSP